jgi:hypothetical protein
MLHLTGFRELSFHQKGDWSLDIYVCNLNK